MCLYTLAFTIDIALPIAKEQSVILFFTVGSDELHYICLQIEEQCMNICILINGEER